MLFLHTSLGSPVVMKSRLLTIRSRRKVIWRISRREALGGNTFWKDAYASQLTDLILDISSYFAPASDQLVSQQATTPRQAQGQHSRHWVAPKRPH